jgi:hypothetical protein
LSRRWWSSDRVRVSGRRVVDRKESANLFSLPLRPSYIFP